MLAQAHAAVQEGVSHQIGLPSDAGGTKETCLWAELSWEHGGCGVFSKFPSWERGSPAPESTG